MDYSSQGTYLLRRGFFFTKERLLREEEPTLKAVGFLRKHGIKEDFVKKGELFMVEKFRVPVNSVKPLVTRLISL